MVSACNRAQSPELIRPHGSKKNSLCVENWFSWMSKYIYDNIVPVLVSMYPCYVTISLSDPISLWCESLSEYLTKRCDIIGDYAYLILRCLCE